MNPGEVFYDVNKRALTRVLKRQRRQTIGYWVSPFETTATLGFNYSQYVWGQDFGWKIEQGLGNFDTIKHTKDHLICAVDELDEPETNEFGPVCP